MPAEHHDLVGLIGARNFGDGVVAGLAFGVDVVDDVESQGDVFAVGDEALDAAVIVVAQNNGGNGGGRVVTAMLLGDDDAFAAGRVVNAQQCAIGHQHGVDLFVDFNGGVARGIGFGRAAPAACSAASASAAVGISRVVLALHDIVGLAFGRGIEVDRDDGRFADEDDFSIHLIFVGGDPLGHFGLERAEALRAAASATTAASRTAAGVSRLRRGHGPLRRFELDNVTINDAIGRRGPREHFEFQVLLYGRDDVAVGRFIEPAWMPEVPRFQMAVFHAPFRHFRDSPLSRHFVIRGAGDTRTIPIRQHVQGLKNLRVFQFFAPHLRVAGFVHFFLAEEKKRHRESKQQLFHD